MHPKSMTISGMKSCVVQLDFNTASVISGLEGQATNRSYMYSTILGGH